MIQLRSGAHQLCDLSGSGKQGRGRLTAQRRLARRRQIVEDMTVLLLKGGHDGHHGFHKARAVGTLGAKASFAPEHPGADGAFGRIIGRLDLLMPHERPQRLPPLADLPTRPFCFRDTTGLSCFEQSLHLPPDRSHIGGKAGMAQGAIVHPMPPLEHLTGLRPQGFSNRLGPSFRTSLCNLSDFCVPLKVLYNRLPLRGDCHAGTTLIP
jgi:hypothetical protein